MHTVKYTYYTLSDKNSNVFYVGMTFLPLEMRIKAHLSEAKRYKWSKKYNAVKCLKIIELEYNIIAKVIDAKFFDNTCPIDRRNARNIEKIHINGFLIKGCKLANREYSFFNVDESLFLGNIGDEIKVINGKTIIKKLA